MNQRKSNECEINECSSMRAYGCFCRKHKDNYLLDTDGYLLNQRFTNNPKDYKVCSLKKTCEQLAPQKKKQIKKLKKPELFNLYSLMIKWSSVSDYEGKVIQSLQRKVKKTLQDKLLIKSQGPAVLNRSLCNNSEDFYTFEDIEEVPQKYFYSYKDDKDIVWGFDIRSLVELMQNNGENPYTRISLPQVVKDDISRIQKSLIKEKLHTTHKKIVSQDKTTLLYQRVTDLFSRIEYNGYSCSENWMLSLSLNNLKKLYRNLEDIWNYRLQQTNEQKIKICPPNGVNFARSSFILHTNSREAVIDVLISDICRFERAQDPNDTKLGYMYFLIGLGGFSRECYETHYEWLSLQF